MYISVINLVNSMIRNAHLGKNWTRWSLKYNTKTNV